ncbi:hypothetical protein N7522_011583 [Penicillium canescens]|uniref:Uncharacterized protein n=1 Tax=Penicillium canescens TaxID=5083 RepID=A0AAD6NDH5_PENCN|nr:uncharacterized protein N7446_007303 [Penicillium canescens]KAJ5991376.1 hypothetical protein N7522_011583 [Penicillium canescens]KAJ6049367.1 hypothetical protein N7444_006083 [Penicillium canescens]KAJ6052663.1 hypothetical protein N7460_003197 [Penicillium canescens]KAJ6063183.1 hypothetical protein N7446_007303 [Penicillium canescens]
MIESGLSESHNAFVTIFMPNSDVAQVPFIDQSEQFGMLDNPVVPDITAPTFSISDPPLPDFDEYVAMQ